MKKAITVGQATMYAETIPINLILDKTYTHPEEIYRLDRFLMLECDGIYIVMVESFHLSGKDRLKTEAFLDKEDALGYLELYGIVDGKEEPS